MARAIPVFPLVGSISTVRLGSIIPDFSADSIIAPAMRSLTEALGLKLSNFAINSALQEYIAGNRFKRTRGVLPTREVMSGAMGIDDFEKLTVQLTT
tara:strand:+ start:664 stop:954 length:291 start_codon:yes stop_codon:yes gene_type:complete